MFPLKNLAHKGLSLSVYINVARVKVTSKDHAMWDWKWLFIIERVKKIWAAMTELSQRTENFHPCCWGIIEFTTAQKCFFRLFQNRNIKNTSPKLANLKTDWHQSTLNLSLLLIELRKKSLMCTCINVLTKKGSSVIDIVIFFLHSAHKFWNTLLIFQKAVKKIKLWNEYNEDITATFQESCSPWWLLIYWKIVWPTLRKDLQRYFSITLMLFSRVIFKNTIIMTIFIRKVVTNLTCCQNP